jgi:hypothetical protein
MVLRERLAPPLTEALAQNRRASGVIIRALHLTWHTKAQRLKVTSRARQQNLWAR